MGRTVTALKPKAEVIHLHTDHLGTPKEATDADGHLVWTADYAAWGKARTATPPRRMLGRQGNTVIETLEEQADPVECNLRFQGQYFDTESGLHYNRFRYYDPDVGRFVSQDPIGLAGGSNLYQYAPNPTFWIDPDGLCSKKLDRALGGKRNDGMQAHHLIPEEKWKKHGSFFDSIGMGAEMDNASNGLLMPGSRRKARQMRRQFYHCGSHRVYSAGVDAAVTDIRNDFESGAIDAAEARNRISLLQQGNRAILSTPGRRPVRLF